MKTRIVRFLTGIGVVFSVMLAVSAFFDNGIYTNYRAPHSLNQNTGSYSKVGKASAVNYLGVIRTGDCSYQAALTSAGITKVHHVDTEYKGTIFKKVATTYVYGE